MNTIGLAIFCIALMNKGHWIIATGLFAIIASIQFVCAFILASESEAKRRGM